MQCNILLNILFELLSKKRTTAGYLAEKYDLSVRTIYRYVEELSSAVPVSVYRGRNGGIVLSDTYKLPVGFMNKEEYGAAIEALEQTYSRRCEERFLSAKRKLSSEYKKEETERALFSCEQDTLVDGQDFFRSGNFPDKFRIVGECIRDCSVLEINCGILGDEDERNQDDRGEDDRRKIEPHAFVFVGGSWQIWAFCRKRRAFRLFSPGVILSAVKTQEKFIRRPYAQRDIFSALRTADGEKTTQTLPHAPSSEGIYPDKNASENIPDSSLFWTARLKIQPDRLYEIAEKIGGENLYKNSVGEWYAEIKIARNSNFAAKILSLGEGAEVISPEELRRKIYEYAEKTAAKYR